MDNYEQTETVHLFEEKIEPGRRRGLLPLWLKIFIWIFIIMGAIIPIILVIAFFGGSSSLALYGLETTKAFSLTGIFVSALFVFKGIVSFGLWTEKSWAVDLAIADALLGILVCVIVMFAELMAPIPVFRFRLELILLVPYLIWLFRLRRSW